MFELIILGLFGSIALAGLFSGGEDDDADNEPAVEDDPLILDSSEAGDLLGFGGTLSGSAGDDSVHIDVSDIVELTAISLGDGDDEGDFSATSTNGTVEVFGGAGDDTLSGGGDSDSAAFDLMGEAGSDMITAGLGTNGYGGDGNDFLYGGEGSTIFGGEGDDVLGGDTLSEFRLTPSREAYGGEGDDTLIIERTAGDILLDEDTFGEWEKFEDAHYGGEGADTFQVTVEQANSNGFLYKNEDEEDQQKLLTLSDFTAGEDVLELIFEMPVLSVNLVQEGDSVRLEFTYEEEIFDEDRSEVVGAYIVLGDSTVTLDDIIINAPGVV